MKIFLCALLFTSASFAASFVPNSFSANFEQSIMSTATGKEKKSYGKIDYKFSGNIRFEVREPVASTFVSNQEKSWYYQPPFIEGEQGEVTIQKSSKLPLTKLLDSLKNGIEGSKLFTHQFKGNDLTLSFLANVQKEMNLKEVVLHGSKDAKTITKLGEFSGMTLVQPDGKKVNLKLIDVKEDTSFPANHFEFVVPPKTKILNN